MCGLTGYFSRQWPGNESASRIKCMTDSIASRGPDSEGHWLDADSGVALSYLRLSIVDLSPAGHHPMYSGLGDQLHKAAGVLSAASIDALYLGLVSHWDDPASVVIGGTEPPTLLTGNAPQLDWAESLLDEARLQREGYFHPAPIRQKWTEHLSGARNWQYHLWDVLMFQASLEVQ